MPEFRELTRRKYNVPIAFRLAGCKPGMRLSRRLGGGVTLQDDDKKEKKIMEVKNANS